MLLRCGASASARRRWDRDEFIDEVIELYWTKECSGGTSNLGLLAGQFVFSTILSLESLMSGLPLNSSEVVSMAKTDKLDHRRWHFCPRHFVGVNEEADD